jgi:RHS repeat-associated protein
MFSAAKEEMTLSTCGDPCALFPLAAFEGVGQNSRLGITTKNPALHQGSSGVISTTALGMPPVLRWEAVRSRYTGKERDSESGLDNFGARYDSSQYGRFMTPDWSEWSDPVPYADLDDPQTLNLYAYVRNNPLAFADRDGHDHCSGADGRDPDSCTANKGTWVIGNEPKQQPQQSNADDQKIRDFASQINQRNILANTAKIYGASAVVGLTGGTVCYYLCPEAATVSLAGETGTDLIEGTNTLNKVIGGEQRELLKDFFKTGERPNGLSDRTLKIYKDVAQRAIDAGKDGLKVQAERIKMIANALK